MQELTIEQRKIIYKARRGLKELDFYLDYYIKHGYLVADGEEQATFALLLDYEDPDLLLYFLGQALPPCEKVADLIDKIKQAKHKDCVY